MVSALITLYNPSPKVRDNVLSICPQVDRVFLCDNSPKPSRGLFDGIKDVHYIFNAANLAQSAAYNRILNDAAYGWGDEDYVVFFDQDSSIKPGHIDGLINEYEALSAEGYEIGCLGPVYFDHSTNQAAIPRIRKDITDDSFIVKTIITSSMLCKYGDLRVVDFWNEDLFLDMADWDLCFRFLRQGKVSVETKRVVMDHTVGIGYKKAGPIGMALSSSFREYYQTKNYLYLLHKSYVPLGYKLEFIWNLTVRPLLHYFLLEDGKERMSYIKKGGRDYRAGYFGEYKDV